MKIENRVSVSLPQISFVIFVLSAACLKSVCVPLFVRECVFVCACLGGGGTGDSKTLTSCTPPFSLSLSLSLSIAMVLGRSSLPWQRSHCRRLAQARRAGWKRKHERSEREREITAEGGESRRELVLQFITSPPPKEKKTQPNPPNNLIIGIATAGQ